MNVLSRPLKPFGVLLEPKKNNISINDVDIKLLRKLFLQKHLIILRGFETFQNSDEFASYCESWGEVCIWPFGKVLELVAHDNPDDHIFDHSYMPMHWDGMYRQQIPEYQFFHCVNAPLPEQGGRTIFSNTISVLKNTAPEIKKVWRNVTGIYERKMAFYNSKTISPIITKHPYHDFEVIRYNEPHIENNEKFINPPNLQFTGVDIEALESFHCGLKQALYSPEHCLAHEWQNGDVVIADNFSLLHGRERFVSKSSRHIRRVQVLSNPPFDNPCLESYQ